MLKNFKIILREKKVNKTNVQIYKNHFQIKK